MYSANFKENFSIESISKDKTWLSLLHYTNGEFEVKDKDFFLNQNANNTPKDELIATIESYNTKNISDNSPLCKFPARYFYLSKYMDFENYQVLNPTCKKLDNWQLFKNIKSISLVLVSGYMSNPASTFGHSFLKFNTDTKLDLFNTSINYGAIVPDGENILLYIAKGL